MGKRIDIFTLQIKFKVTMLASVRTNFKLINNIVSRQVGANVRNTVLFLEQSTAVYQWIALTLFFYHEIWGATGGTTDGKLCHVVSAVRFNSSTQWEFGNK